MSETSEIVNDCLTHYNQRHIQVRWDYFTLCVYNPDQYNQKVNDKGHVIKDEPNQECMAKILRIMETLTDAKRLQWHIDAKNAREKGLTPPQEPKEWPIELAYEAIVELLYHTFGENIVRNSVAVLLERSYIKRYQAGTNTIPIYYLNIPLVQTALKKQAENALVGVESNTHVKRRKKVLKVTPNDSKVTPKSLKVTPEGVENKGAGSESNTNNIDNNNSNNTDNNPKRESPPNTLDTHTIVSSDTARADSLQDEEMFRNDAPQGDTHATAASGHPHRVGDTAARGVDGAGSPNQDRPLVAPEVRPVLEAQEITEGEHHATRVPTVPRADHPASSERAVSRPGSDHSHSPSMSADGLPMVRPVGSGTPGEEAGRDTRDAGRDATQTLAQTPPTSMPAQSLPPPQTEQAASGATRARTRQEKPTLIDPSPAPEDAVLQGRCKEWYKRITEHCGGPMTKGGQVINEHRCVKMLCQKYDDRQLEAIFKYLTKRHWKWSKIDNRFNVRAFIVWDEACGVAQILREERQPTNEEDTPLLSVEEEFGRYWGINEKRGMSYATA